MTKTLNATKTAPSSTATATKDRLGFLVRLNFQDDQSNSDKWWEGAFQGTTIITRFGRQGSGGQQSIKSFDTIEKAAAYYWNLLREKVGKKGYHLDSARTLKSNEDITVRDWGVLLPKKWDQLGYPDLQGLSQRTAKVGAKVILELSDPNADEDFLFEAANADPSERFLVPLVLSHPNCPDEAKVMQILITNNAVNY